MRRPSTSRWLADVAVPHDHVGAIDADDARVPGQIVVAAGSRDLHDDRIGRLRPEAAKRTVFRHAAICRLQLTDIIMPPHRHMEEPTQRGIVRAEGRDDGAVDAIQCRMKPAGTSRSGRSARRRSGIPRGRSSADSTLRGRVAGAETAAMTTLQP